MQRSKYYSTKFEPPKKESKDKKLSDGIRKFLQQREAEEQREKVRKKREYEELMANRSERDKNKIRKHLKVTKSANKSVLDDAVNKTDTAVTMQGPEQPDEDDYGYTSHEASALYKSLMDKYKTIPEDKKFSKSSLGGCKNADLMSTKDRVRAAILREREEEKLGRKRTHTSSSTGDIDGARNSSSSLEPKHRSRSNLYDPKAEREAEERKREEERRQKMKAKRPPPPVMDFQKLLKLAEEKQHQPIQIEVPQKPKEPERLLTSKEKKELEVRKREMEERERRKNGLPPLSKSQTNNGDARKADVPSVMAANGRIPKLNGTNAPMASNKAMTGAAAPSRVPPPKLQSTNNSGVRKPNATPFKEPIRPVSSISSSKLSTKPQSQPHSNGAMKSANSATTSSAMHAKQRPPVDTKTKGQSHDVQRNISKQSKPIDSRNVKAREFPPRDVVKSREFPPRDVVRAREFPPRDLIKSREFPPRDVQRSGHGSMKQKQSVASKRRILDDSDEDEYDSEMDDFIDDGDEELDYSSEIRKMFGYDKSRFRDDDDDVDNMESSFAQQQREEFISKKAGLMEDLEDMRLEAEEKKRKAQKRRRH